MKTLKKHALVTLTAIAVAMLCGIIAAFLIAAAIAVKSAERDLTRKASQITSIVDGVIDEAHSILATMKKSQSPLCSDGDINLLRRLIFESENMRDAGRMLDGRLQCSATLGRHQLPLTKFVSTVELRGGISIYTDFSMFSSSGTKFFALQTGESYVVLNPQFYKRLDMIAQNRSYTMIDEHSGRLAHIGDPLPAFKGLMSNQNWQARVGKSLFVTRCSTRYPFCMTTWVPISEAVTAKRNFFILYPLTGGVAGALCGFIFSLLYYRRRSLCQQLRRAIRKDKLRVAYQPIVNLATGRIVGAEALVRWTDEDGAPVSPDIFVKLAEERGFVGSITELVLRKSMEDFAETLRSNPEFRLSINVSAADLADQALLPMLQQSLENAAVHPSSLAIEITESATARYPMAIDTLVQLRERGHSVLVDDFGTGYSSLSYLQDLAVDTIKIDRSFTRSIGTDAVTATILPQILAMAAALNLDVIVEGIETDQQANYFAGSVRCILAQGWLFGRPVWAGEFRLMMEKQNRKPQVIVAGASADQAAGCDTSPDAAMAKAGDEEPPSFETGTSPSFVF